jgi:hypothetical protein
MPRKPVEAKPVHTTGARSGLTRVDLNVGVEAGPPQEAGESQPCVESSNPEESSLARVFKGVSETRGNFTRIDK